MRFAICDHYCPVRSRIISTGSDFRLRRFSRESLKHLIDRGFLEYRDAEDLRDFVGSMTQAMAMFQVMNQHIDIWAKTMQSS